MARHCSDQSIGRSIRRLTQNPRGRRDIATISAGSGCCFPSRNKGNALTAPPRGRASRSEDPRPTLTDSWEAPSTTEVTGPPASTRIVPPRPPTPERVPSLLAALRALHHDVIGLWPRAAYEDEVVSG